MNNETITLRQSVCCFISFLIGSSSILGISRDAEQDVWISLLFALAMVLPVLLIFGRIIHLLPGLGFFDMLQALFGPVLGRICALLYTWYAIHLGSLVMRNFSEYTQIISMSDTPQLALMIIMLLVALFLAKSRIKTLGKWSIVSAVLIAVTILITTILLLGIIDFKNFQPVMGSGMSKILAGSYKIFTFPFAETVLFLTIADSFTKIKSPYKMYIYALLISGGLMLIILFKNIGALGSELATEEYFPSYSSARLIALGNFLTRVEGSISTSLVLGGVTKVTICLIAASKGLAYLFNIKDYKILVLPAGLFMLAICPILYESTMQMFGFLEYYQYYAIPFQILIPVAVWITAEAKNYKKKHPEGIVRKAVVS